MGSVGMQLSVFRQTLRETRQSMVRWILVLVGSVWLSLLAQPLLLWISGGRFHLDQFPNWLVFLLDSQADLSVLQNWAQTITLGIILPALVIIFVVHEGSRLIAGEEERGSLGLLLATPLRRYHLVLQKFVVLLVFMVACAAGVWLALSLVSWSGLLPLSNRVIVGAGPALFFLGLGFGSLAMAIGSLTGRHHLSRHLTWLYGLLVFLVSRIPAGFPGYPLARWVSPYSFYILALFGVDYWVNIFLLFLFALVSLGAAWVIFENRDLPV